MLACTNEHGVDKADKTWEDLLNENKEYNEPPNPSISSSSRKTPGLPARSMSQWINLVPVPFAEQVNCDQQAAALVFLGEPHKLTFHLIKFRFY